MPYFLTHWFLCALASANIDCTSFKNEPDQKVREIGVPLHTEGTTDNLTKDEKSY